MKDKKLAQNIIKMHRHDQRVRNIAITDPYNKKKIKDVYQMDKRHYPILKNIIKKYGLPTFDLVGKQASNAFWNLIQHADYHKEFQKKVLELMKKALKEGQVYAKNVAFLTDRVRDNYGQKIIFGTQFLFKDKKIIQKKVLYPKKLEQIRKEYGLEPTKVTLKKHYKKYKASLK